jgi:hypothetical protein
MLELKPKVELSKFELHSMDLLQCVNPRNN